MNNMYLISDSILSDTADAIRSINDSTELIKPIDFPSMISEIGTKIKYETVDFIRNIGGSAYIDTGIEPNKETIVKMKVKNSNQTAYFFGCWANNFMSNAYAFCNDNQSLYLGYDGQGGSSFVNKIVSHDQEAIIELRANKVYIDNTLEYTFTKRDFNCPYNIYLFAQNRTGSPGWYWLDNPSNEFDLLECQIYEDGVNLSRDFVPIVITDYNVGALYDKLNNKVYVSANVGKPFSWGNY